MRDLSLFLAPDIESEQSLPEAEAAHASRVLRLCVGDEVYVTDGKGRLWTARLGEVSRHGVRLVLGAEEPWHKPWSGRIRLAVAPTKSIDRIEWLLEKAVEIGVDEICLLRSKHSERKHINQERLERIILSAMKQSHKALLPQLYTGLDYTQALERAVGGRVLIAHCRDTEALGLPTRVLPHIPYIYGEDVSIFIGPEGDFSVQELEQAHSMGAVGITLGESRLRTETAALVALQWWHTLGAMHNNEKQ